MTSHFPEAVGENLRFLGAEVDSQLGYLQRYLSRPSAATARRILDRSGYANNLRMRIHEASFNRLSEGTVGKTERLALVSLGYVATNLERITEKCRDAVKQLEYLEDINCLQVKASQTMLRQLRKAIRLVEEGVFESNTANALEMGQVEGRIERAYQRLVKTYTEELKRRKRTEDLTRSLFITLAIKQMSDSLLRISEAIISMNLGQPISFERYQSLQELSDEWAGDDEIQIEPIAETRSGSAISGVTRREGGAGEYVAIFKDGQRGKLKEERQGVESWHEIYPGLAPKILSYRRRGESAALLIEHLSGLTLEQILLRESTELVNESLQQLAVTLTSVWRETRTDKAVSAGFMQQLENRLSRVYQIHPEFQRGNSRLCGHRVDSFDKLISRACTYEKQLQAPFSVYIHGDFNVDNIIYDPVEQRINFIDLHRSRHMDYVQDVSVFMVSNYRLQILDAPVRRRLMDASLAFYDIVRRFAHKQQDKTFELRLALGLARSFSSSTRFILDKSMARRMQFRSRYLIEHVLSADSEKPQKFKLPLKEIFVD